jgi:RNA polymerase sigma-70 factor (ECF subfamily)
MPGGEMSTDPQWSETVERLYNKHFDALHRIAWRCLSDRNTVRDVIQEIFTRLLEGRRRFATLEDAERYLFRSFKNLLIDKARSRARWRYVELDRANERLITSGAVQEDELVNRRIEGKSLPLPEPDRGIFALAYFEKKTDEEIASQLNLKLSTIRYRLRKARQAITHILVEEHHFGQKEIAHLFSRIKT